jgi:hypothetical protein
MDSSVRFYVQGRKWLEPSCRYITRPALSDERVQLNAAGQVELKLKTLWRDLQGWILSHRLGGSGARASWCRIEAAPPEHRLARAGLDRHRLRRPQRRLRLVDAAQPVGVPLPNEGQPLDRVRGSRPEEPRRSGEAVRMGAAATISLPQTSRPGWPRSGRRALGGRLNFLCAAHRLLGLRARRRAEQRAIDCRAVPRHPPRPRLPRLPRPPREG